MAFSLIIGPPVWAGVPRKYLSYPSAGGLNQATANLPASRYRPPPASALATGVNATSALVLSQVVLSFGIPFALVPLVVLTSKASVMGGHVNRRHTVICAIACVAVIIALNALILFQQFAA